MGGLSIWHWLVVGILILLLFGKGRFSSMMGDVAEGLKSFKKGMSEDEEDLPPRRIEVEPVTPAFCRCGRVRIADAGQGFVGRDDLSSGGLTRAEAAVGSCSMLVPASFWSSPCSRFSSSAPKDLPRVLNQLGKWVAKARAMTRHVKSGLETMAREAELEDMERQWAEHNAKIMDDNPPEATVVSVATAQ